MLRKLLRDTNCEAKILMTASTHNAVDNVLERFIKLNKVDNLLPEEQILRVATDQSKVNRALQGYTIDARVGGDITENNKLAKRALERLKSAVLVFTTCAGAGLGALRKVDFDIALIDEASQITEPCALIPLVKGVKKGILVGDHVQLRPTVRRMAKALEFAAAQRHVDQSTPGPYYRRGSAYSQWERLVETSRRVVLGGCPQLRNAVKPM
ncbi:hypothetical protein HGRIS_000114 [Hohenbuehelia grisea]|uniref:DNA2/NAM7 helicase helicase domain-containing protein n=1 Tax=Hohenbuehelia grisea TaxID=104357 RepID=A0ABR3JQ33_9AGAR